MPATQAHQEPTASEIRDELSRILQSAEFAASSHLARFLQYVVDESLAGKAASIKERNVAVHALQRDASYDPRTDPVVRMVAGKLRRALKRFYDGDGATNAVRIEVPKGGYRPRFKRVDVTQPGDLSLIASAGQPMSIDSDRTRRPILAVAPFIAFSRGIFERHVADAIAQDICVQLSRFSWFEVTDFLTALNLSRKKMTPLEIASSLCADFFLSGTIRKHDSSLRVTVQLADAALGRIIWAERFTLHTDDQELARQDGIVERVAARIGDVYGVLATTVLSKARRKSPERVTLCEAVMANLRYQLHLADGMFANALQSAEQAIRTDPEFAWGWAALGLLHMDNFLFSIDQRASEAAENALFCIREALKADAECGLAHFTQGVYHLTHGEVEQCVAAGERTVEFAHGSPFEMAGGGGLLAMVGEDERSKPLVDWAINNNPGLPGWVHWAATANHVKRGEYRQALLATQRFSLPECFWDHLFRAAAQVLTGDNEHAERSVSRAVELRPSLVERRREMVTKLVPEPALRKLLVDELPRVK